MPQASLDLYVDNQLRDTWASYSPSFQWMDAAVSWQGFVSAGTHSVWLSSPDSGSPETGSGWGCGYSYGGIEMVALAANATLPDVLTCRFLGCYIQGVRE